jgi:FkbM family methyltransferase
MSIKLAGSLLQFLFQRDRANTSRSQLKKVTIHGKKVKYRVRIPKYELFRIKKIFSRHDYAIPKDFLTIKTPIVVDVGANVGLFALYMKMIRPESIIHCFEPVPTTLELLQANVGYMSDFHIYPFGLSNCNQKAAMSLHPSNTGQHSVKFTFPQSEQKIEISLCDAAETMERIQVHTIDILKIDAEGCEVEILESLQPKLDDVGMVIVEYHGNKDRRRIDQLLSQFYLIGASVTKPEVGVLKYIHERFVSLPVP